MPMFNSIYPYYSLHHKVRYHQKFFPSDEPPSLYYNIHVVRLPPLPPNLSVAFRIIFYANRYYMHVIRVKQEVRVLLSDKFCRCENNSFKTPPIYIILQYPKYPLPEPCGRRGQCELNQKSEKKDFQSFKRTVEVLHVGRY